MAESISTNDDYFAVPAPTAESLKATEPIDASANAFGSPAPPLGVSKPAPLPPPAHESATKVLDFGAPAWVPPASPVTPVPFKSTDPSTVDYYEFVSETLMWKFKIRSAFYLCLGLFQILVIRYVLASKTPVISGVCFLLLLNLGINFSMALVTRQRPRSANWSNSRLTKGFVYVVSEGVNASAAVLDKHLSGSDPIWTLQVAAGLWLLSLLARAVSAVDLLLALHLAAFIVPVSYSTFKHHVDAQASQAWGTAMAQLSKLDRRSKVIGVAVVTILFALLISRVDIAIAVLIIAIFTRSLMSPGEVDDVSRKVAPITDQVANVGAQLSNFAGHTAARFELTPTPSKKKAL